MNVNISFRIVDIRVVSLVTECLIIWIYVWELNDAPDKDEAGKYVGWWEYNRLSAPGIMKRDNSTRNMMRMAFSSLL